MSMLDKIFILVLLTLLPFLELRYSIPAGILLGRVGLPFGLALVGFGLNPFVVFFVCVIVNILLGMMIFLVLDKVIHHFLRFKVFKKIYDKIITRSQEKIRKYVEKYGELGVALFIAIPLPGSGVYSGALGAYALGLDFRKFIIADIIGVTIAGIIVTLISTGLHNLL